MVSARLKQIPREALTFYCRLINHEAFFAKLAIVFEQTVPSMSRDLLIGSTDQLAANSASKILLGLTAGNAVPPFAVDSRGDTLFITSSYPHEITAGSKVLSLLSEEVLQNLHQKVAFLAIKSGHHHLIGYSRDAAPKPADLPESLPLEPMCHRVMDHFGSSSFQVLSHRAAVVRETCAYTQKR